MRDPITQEIINALSEMTSRTLDEVERLEAIPGSEATIEKLLEKTGRIQGLISYLDSEAERISRLPKDMNDAIRRKLLEREPTEQPAKVKPSEVAGPNQAMNDVIREAGRQ